MKLITAFAFSIAFGAVWAQEPPYPPQQSAPEPPPTIEKRQEPDIFEVVEQPAEFPGGRAGLMKYLSDNLVYPADALEKGLEGKCYIRFIVSATGKVSNVTIRRGVPDCPACDKEAARVVSVMPDWKPGFNNGKAVNSYFNLPVMFKLAEPTPPAKTN